MAQNDEKCLEVVTRVAKEMEDFNKSVENVMYRSDYMDYIVLLDDDTVCLIREKLIDDWEQDKKGDIRREIEFKLKTAEVVEGMEGEEVLKDEEEEDKIVIDKNPEDTDWI